MTVVLTVRKFILRIGANMSSENFAKTITVCMQSSRIYCQLKLEGRVGRSAWAKPRIRQKAQCEQRENRARGWDRAKFKIEFLLDKFKLDDLTKFPVRIFDFIPQDARPDLREVYYTALTRTKFG